MGGARQKRFVGSAEELAEQRFAAKLGPCPHCRQRGAVNAHGFLHGYSESGEFAMVRGRRFFCSNRGLRPGCGRTFSILLATLLACFVVMATTLSRFVFAVLAGLSIARAWLRVAGHRFSLSTGYRLWRRMCCAQVHIRSQLYRRGPPEASQSHRPLDQLLEHMKIWISEKDGAFFAAFQLEFQTGVFA